MVKIVDKNSKIPLYVQLMDILIQDINKLEENEKIMSEREICEIYDVSRTTVRQTLDELEKNKYIYKVHGKGTFVQSRRHNQELSSFYSFTEEMKRIGKIPSSDILAFEIIEADDKLKMIFDLSDEAFLYKIIRTRKADLEPMMHEVTYILYERFKGLEKKDLEKTALYDVLRDKFSLNIKGAEESFEPVLTNKLESFYLNIEEGTPCLKIERFTYENHTLIEYTKSIARGDKFKYKVKLIN